MNLFSDLSDEEFVPFLNSLGVETYKKSFEWMLSDPDFSGILRWLYNNLDCRNALTAREEYRYAELKKKGMLLPSTELEAVISTILEEHEGLPLPGDQEALDDVKFDTEALKERLAVLEKQEAVLEDLIRQNEIAKEELNCEVTKLNAEQNQYKEDDLTASAECLALAREVENVTDSVVDIIADTLAVYENCHTDKETAKGFLAFGPFEAYQQCQALFRSHFDLYTSRKFSKKQNENASIENDLRVALIEAKALEDRLEGAILSYIDTKAELCGEQAKLSLLANYESIHPTQIPAATIDARGAIELLEQEESILEQQSRPAVRRLAASRAALAAGAAARSALAVREEIYKDLTHLHDTTLHALALDRCLCFVLRHSLQTHEELLQFAAELARYAQEERAAVVSRLVSMKSICVEQQSAEDNLRTRDVLLTTLSAILGVQPSNDVIALVKTTGDLENSVKELKEKVEDGFRRKEEFIEDFKRSQQPLAAYLWDGATKQPNCQNRTVAALAHCLTSELDAADRKVAEAGALFAQVKNGDKQNLRKLWQWFLTDQARLAAVMKETQSQSYS